MKKTILKVFSIFTLDYGNTWTNSRDDDLFAQLVERWNEVLERFSDEILMKAAKSSISTYKDFPPSLGQFVDICKKIEKDTREFTTGDVMRLEQKKNINSIEELVNQAGGSEIQQREMSKIRRILSGEKIDIGDGMTVDERYDKMRADGQKEAEDYIARLQLRPPRGTYA